jgi:hypothetical protein
MRARRAVHVMGYSRCTAVLRACGRRPQRHHLRALADASYRPVVEGALLHERAPPQDATANEGRAKQGPLAIPFTIDTRSKARAEFEGWRGRQGGLTFDSSAMKTKAVKPVYLPFFAFDGSLTATFTGRLGYTTRETYTYTDSKGNKQTKTRRRTDWYTKTNMRVGPRRIDPTGHLQMLQCAAPRTFSSPTHLPIQNRPLLVAHIDTQVRGLRLSARVCAPSDHAGLQQAA